MENTSYKTLKKILKKGIDGRNSNCYAVLEQALRQIETENKKDLQATFSLGDLYRALKQSSKEWEKETEEYLSE